MALDAAAVRALAGRPVAEAVAALVAIYRTEVGYFDAADSASSSTYVTLAGVAAETLATLRDGGAVLVDELANDDTFSIPEPCYDQGMYIGDYVTKSVRRGDLATNALTTWGPGAWAALPRLVAALVDPRRAAAAKWILPRLADVPDARPAVVEALGLGLDTPDPAHREAIFLVGARQKEFLELGCGHPSAEVRERAAELLERWRLAFERR